MIVSGQPTLEICNTTFPHKPFHTKLDSILAKLYLKRFLREKSIEFVKNCNIVLHILGENYGTIGQAWKTRPAPGLAWLAISYGH